MLSLLLLSSWLIITVSIVVDARGIISYQRPISKASLSRWLLRFPVVCACFCSPTALGSNGHMLLHSQHCVGTDSPGKDEELSPSSDPALLCARPWGPAHSRANPGTAALPVGWKSAATGDAGRPSTAFPAPAPAPPAETGLCARPRAGRHFPAWSLHGSLCCCGRRGAAHVAPCGSRLRSLREFQELRSRHWQSCAPSRGLGSGSSTGRKY